MFGAMRIFVAGATGVLGARIIRLLVEDSHEVAGMTRSSGKMPLIEEVGAEPILCDVFDLGNLRDSVSSFKPDLIIDQLTDLPDDYRELPDYAKANNRIRTVGTENLLQAAKESNHPKFIVQSVAWELPGTGNAAVKEMENKVIRYGGSVFRYGQLYGPGTYYETGMPSSPRIHVDKAAELTVKNLNSKEDILEIVE